MTLYKVRVALGAVILMFLLCIDVEMVFMSIIWVAAIVVAALMIFFPCWDRTINYGQGGFSDRTWYINE